MKILHILYSGLGGQGNVFFSMVNADVEKKYDYEALFMGVEELLRGYPERCNTAGIPFAFIKKKAGQHSLFFGRILKYVLKSNAEVVFIHGSILVSAVWAAKKLGLSDKRIILRETQAIHLKSSREVLAFKIAMRLADRIVFLSEEYNTQIKKDFGKKYIGSKISVIPNGIDLTFYAPDSSVQKEDTITIGMQSRIVAIKDHITLLQAFAIIVEKFPEKSFQLKIAGDGPLLDSLKEATKSLNIESSTTFTGMLAEKRLPAFLNSLDIYVHASLGETMSTAIMQAMACGKAVIASDVDGINNMILDNKTGLLVLPKDKKALADAIEKLIFNDRLKQTISSAALTYAKQNFSNEIMFDKYSKLFSENK